jgi:hypothetical protein
MDQLIGCESDMNQTTPANPGGTASLSNRCPTKSRRLPSRPAPPGLFLCRFMPLSRLSCQLFHPLHQVHKR